MTTALASVSNPCHSPGLPIWIIYERIEKAFSFIRDEGYIFAVNNPVMTYEEVHLLYDRLESFAIGTPVKGRLIQSLSIAPTDWEQMTDFMNLRIKVGEEAALIEFSSRGKSLSVYGVSVTKIDGEVPKWEMTILDNWELIIGN